MFMLSKWLGTFFFWTNLLLSRLIWAGLFSNLEHQWNSPDRSNLSDTRTECWFFGLRECSCVLLLLCLYTVILLSFVLGNVRLRACACRMTSNTSWEKKNHNSKINMPWFKHELQSRCKRTPYSPTECVHLCASLIQTQATFNLLCEDYQLFKTYFVCFNNVCLTLVSAEPDLHGVL